MPAPNAQIHLHDRLAEFIRNWNVVQTYTSLGMFGSLSPKPTKLFSDDGWVTHLQRNSGASGFFATMVAPENDFCYLFVVVVQIYCIECM
jgi:hypothetical protein